MTRNDAFQVSYFSLHRVVDTKASSFEKDSSGVKMKFKKTKKQVSSPRDVLHDFGHWVFGLGYRRIIKPILLSEG